MMQAINNTYTSTQFGGALIAPSQVSDVVNTVTAAQNSGATKESVIDALVALSEILSLVQESTSKAQSLHSKDNYAISQNLVKQMQNNLQSVIENINREEEVQAAKSFWDRLLNAICAVVGFILSAVGLPELGMPLLITSVMNLTGVMQDITQGIADLLEKMGVSKDVANMVANLIIFVAVAAASGASSMGEFADGVSMLKKIACTGLKLTAAVGEGLSCAPQLFSDIAIVALANSDMTEEKKKELESKLAFIQAILGAALALVGGIGASFKTFDKTLTEEGTYLSKLGKAIKTKFNSIFSNAEAFESRMPALSRIMRQIESKRASVAQFAMNLGLRPDRMNLLGQGVNAATGAISGGMHIKFDKMQINALMALAECQSIQEILTSTLKQTDADTTSSIKAFEQRLKTQSKDMADIIGAVVTEGRAVTQALSA